MTEITDKAKDMAEGAKDETSLGQLFKQLFENLKSGKGKESLQSVTAIIIAIFTGKLASLKEDVEKGRKEKEEEAEEEAPGPVAEEEEKPEDKKEDKGPQKTQPSPQPKIDLAKFRSGDLFKALSENFSGVQVIGNQPLKDHTATSNPCPGAPDWPKNSTGNWDFAGAGNTAEEMAKGMYKIQAIDRGWLDKNGYTQRGIGDIPSGTSQKLTAIAMALLNDPRMLLFTGIKMTVDGVEVMMMKEIHMHPRGSASTYLCQPHTGVAFILKKT